MIESKRKEINGNTYTVESLGATKGRQVFVRILRILGSALGDGEFDIAKASRSLAEADVDYLCDVFAPQTRIRLKGSKEEVSLSEIQELHYAGNYLEMIQWLAFCLDLNFRNVFLGAVAEGGPLAGLKAKIASQSSFQPALTGTSTVSS